MVLWFGKTNDSNWLRWRDKVPTADDGTSEAAGASCLTQIAYHWLVTRYLQQTRNVIRDWGDVRRQGLEGAQCVPCRLSQPAPDRQDAPSAHSASTKAPNPRFPACLPSAFHSCCTRLRPSSNRKTRRPQRTAHRPSLAQFVLDDACLRPPCVFCKISSPIKPQCSGSHASSSVDGSCGSRVGGRVSLCTTAPLRKVRSASSGIVFLVAHCLRVGQCVAPKRRPRPARLGATRRQRGQEGQEGQARSGQKGGRKQAGSIAKSQPALLLSSTPVPKARDPPAADRDYDWSVLLPTTSTPRAPVSGSFAALHSHWSTQHWGHWALVD